MRRWKSCARRWLERSGWTEPGRRPPLAPVTAAFDTDPAVPVDSRHIPNTGDDRDEYFPVPA